MSFNFGCQMSNLSTTISFTDVTQAAKMAH